MKSKLVINGITIKEEFWVEDVKTEVVDVELERDIKFESVASSVLPTDTDVTTKTETPVPGKKCNWCDYTPKLKDQLLKHIRNIHNNGDSFKCDECDFTTTHKRDMRGHKKTHWGVQVLKCHNCEYRTCLKSQLSKHVKIHSNWVYKCSLCDFKTYFEKSLTIHKYKHSKRKIFKCKDCDMTFLMKWELKSHCKQSEHMKKNSVPEFKSVQSCNKLYECDKCDYKTMIKRELLGHRKIHLGIKLFKCDNCEFRSPHKSKWKRHITWVHSKYKTFECKLCNFQTSVEKSFLAHKTEHTNEKPFKCDDCGVSYNIKKSFKDHCKRRGHMLNRLELFKCDQCDYVTDIKIKLSWHSKVHSTQKLYECNLCEYKCDFFYYLTRHQKKHMELQQVLTT